MTGILWRYARIFICMRDEKQKGCRRCGSPFFVLSLFPVRKLQLRTSGNQSLAGLVALVFCEVLNESLSQIP